MNRQWILGILGGAGVAAVMALYVLGAYAPMHRHLQKRQAVLRQQAGILEETRAAQQDLERFEIREEKIRMEWERLSERIPLQAGIPQLLKAVTRAASECNLKELQFTPQPPVPRTGFVEHPIRIAVLGDYHGLGRFISQLAGLPRLAAARDVQIKGRDKSGKTDSIQAELIMVTYVRDKP